MASNPVDPLQTLQAALSVPANSEEQAELLSKLRDSLEQHPAPIRVLVGTLITIVVNAGDSLLKTWVIDLLHFAICRSTLSTEQKTQMSSQALDTLYQLLEDPNPAIVKVVVQCLTTVYPLLFRSLCTNRTNPAAWNTVSACKARILELADSPTINLGIKISSLKFMQRIILVQTRGPPDPRLQNKNDPNIVLCPPDHPFIPVPHLEAEAAQLLEQVIKILYTTSNVDILSALLNSWTALIKLRPSMLLPVVVATLKAWTPAAFVGQSALVVKSAEKAIRILLVHLSRLSIAAPYSSQIHEILTIQVKRMEEESRKRSSTPTAPREAKKRPTTADVDRPDVKRLKVDSTDPPAPTAASFLDHFDFTALPASLITDLIVVNLETFSESALVGLVQSFRQNQVAGLAQTTTAAGPGDASKEEAVAQMTQADPVIPPGPMEVPQVKDEPIDPLQMDIDQDELDYEPDRLNEELSGTIEPQTFNDPSSVSQELRLNASLSDFKLPTPNDLSVSDRISLISKSVARICDLAVELQSHPSTAVAEPSAGDATDMWMLLIVRMITRVSIPPGLYDEGDDLMEDDTKVHPFFERQDQLRQTLCDYVMSDFPPATTWMNEEWYNDHIQHEKNPRWRPNYDTWLNQIVVSYQTLLDGKDRTFARFLLDLPSVPQDVLGLLRDLCVDSESLEKMQVGFSTLKGFVMQRPTMRADALGILLELTTHPERKIRGAAINTVKLWVPNTQPMDTMIREFALQILRKLQRAPVQDLAQTSDSSSENKKVQNGNVEPMNQDEATDTQVDPDENMEDGQLPQEDLIQTPYLPERIELPAQKGQVLQHVELLFVLSVKVPEFLDEIFSAYAQMDSTVQEAIQELITALVQSLGPNHGKLLTLMRTCPSGSESLALRILTIFTERERPSAQMVALVKGLINERDLDARFLIPIIAEMDKPDIMRHLPRIVSILNGQPEPKNLVRSVFNSVVAIPPQTFGSVTSNLPRVRQSELLTPAELMVLLHESEKDIGLKSAIEAIGICFSMTDVFRSEILAVVMQQIMDEPVLPVLFLRTVIQAVTTYKSLVKFVSTTLFSRLITKKIWTNPPLWEGFIRCAKVIAPASFGALLQLPKDQLRELVDKQPSLKAGLREYVTKKAPNKARVSGFLDIFAENEDDLSTPPP
ncbi:hypothetical protein D9758_000263 [Tetrapyrgos nigripes]|uniref:Symplekin n=1 Tax=Tetrapyrgos nigripes TaxID=182062 RepID=A0A8H5LZ96_9AGAR|nr:hypothetical protein D9758_000263 [Tetrapyrgos nigripes]